MTREEIRAAVIAALTRIVPEIDPSQLHPDEPFREAYDLDSMDFLNFVIGVHSGLGVDVPEADYGKMATLDGAVGYLASRLGAGSG